MVGVTAILVGYLAGQLLPDTFNGTINSPTLMIGFCVLFAFGVAYIAYRGVNGTTGVNVAVNVIQIAALLVFSVIAIGYRVSHHEGSAGYTLDPDGNADQRRAGRRQGRQADQGRKGRPVQGRAGKRQGQAVPPGVQRHRHHPGAGRQGQAQRREAGHLPVPHLGRLGGRAALASTT